MSVRIKGVVASPGSACRIAVVSIGDDGIIASVDDSPGPVDFDASAKMVVPGFVDIHVHGGGGADFMDGTVADVRRVARTHARFGTTTLLATSLTASRPDIDRFIDAVRAVMDDPGGDEARIGGIHLEGPYICTAKRGAQPLAHIRPPDWTETSEWIERSSGAIRIVTIAPELPGALDFIRAAVSAGIVVSVGHTNATFDETLAALDAGASHGTHLFNAMPPLLHRHPGAVGALLTDSRTYTEMIVDGVHLHPAAVATAMRCRGTERVILITDAIAGAAMPEGCYQLGGTTVNVRGGTAAFADGTLAGSVLTMNQAFRNVMRQTGVNPCAATAMTSLNAASRIGLSDSIGKIEPGRRADLAIVDPQSGAVAATMRDGKWIWRA